MENIKFINAKQTYEVCATRKIYMYIT